jgi:hypothetical protein
MASNNGCHSESLAPQVNEAARLYVGLSELVRVYEFRDGDRICCHDISVTQCNALEALVRVRPRTLNELAAELYRDKSTASCVVTTLERKADVARQTHPRDRRSARSHCGGNPAYEFEASADLGVTVSPLSRPPKYPARSQR